MPLGHFFLVVSNWEESPGKSSLEGLYIPSDMGASWDPPEGSAECHWVEGVSGFIYLTP